MFQIDGSVTGWINNWAGQAPRLDLFMIGFSTAGVPLLVLAVALQWWVPRADRPTRHILVVARLPRDAPGFKLCPDLVRMALSRQWFGQAAGGAVVTDAVHAGTGVPRCIRAAYGVVSPHGR